MPKAFKIQFPTAPYLLYLPFSGILSKPSLTPHQSFSTLSLLSKLRKTKTMAHEFKHKEPVEICKKEEGFAGVYYNATLLAAIGRNKYLVRYETRFNADGTRYLTEAVESEEVRPSFPQISYTNFVVSDRVDAYVNFAWRAGTITRKVDPNYYVRLDCNGNEEHCAFYKVRLHLEWENGRWFYPGSGSQTNQASTSEQGSQPASEDNQANTGELGDQPKTESDQSYLGQ